MNDEERYEEDIERYSMADEYRYYRGRRVRQAGVILPLAFIFGSVGGFVFSFDWHDLVMAFPPVGLYLCMRAEKELFTRRANGERDDLYYRKTMACYGGMALCCLVYFILGKVMPIRL